MLQYHDAPASLADGDIHLWFTHDEAVINTALLSHYFTWMSREEREKQARFYFAEHRHQYLLTRALTRSVLSLYIHSVSPQDWCFDKNAFNKPEIANPEVRGQLYFNISHTKGLIVLAVSKHPRLGVDVERISHKRAGLDIARHAFCPQEVRDLQNLPTKSQQVDRFFTLWTLKEAYIKACGMGLSIPLDQFGFSFVSDKRFRLFFSSSSDDKPEHWQLYQLNATPTVKMAVAMGTSAQRQSYVLSAYRTVPLESMEAIALSIDATSIHNANEL